MRYDVSFRKEGKGGTGSHFVKIGVAFPEEKGRIAVLVDCLPVGEWDGRLMLFPQEGER